VSRLGGAVLRTLALVARLLGRAPRTLPVVLTPEDAAVFPDPLLFDEQGLIAIGGDLSPARLLAAYRAGIFPWYGDDTPILWWSPDPRAVIELDGLHVSRRLARTVRGGKFEVTFDREFAAVMAGCGDREEGTWITPEMHSAYVTLHAMGHAHSVEVWNGGELAGGVYGVTVGGLFAGESMFSRVTDASKVALVHLVDRLRERGFRLFDIQYLNDHTRSLGGVEIPREEYLGRLREALELGVTFG
jgi:leucyl/phenylalanyl-tRNA---protein transferase